VRKLVDQHSQDLKKTESMLRGLQRRITDVTQTLTQRVESLESPKVLSTNGVQESTMVWTPDGGLHNRAFAERLDAVALSIADLQVRFESFTGTTGTTSTFALDETEKQVINENTPRHAIEKLHEFESKALGKRSVEELVRDRNPLTLFKCISSKISSMQSGHDSGKCLDAGLLEKNNDHESFIKSLTATTRALAASHGNSALDMSNVVAEGGSASVSTVAAGLSLDVQTPCGTSKLEEPTSVMQQHSDTDANNKSSPTPRQQYGFGCMQAHSFSVHSIPSPRTSLQRPMPLVAPVHMAAPWLKYQASQ